MKKKSLTTSLSIIVTFWFMLTITQPIIAQSFTATATKNLDKEIRLEWKKCKFPNPYNVYRSTSKQFTPNKKSLIKSELISKLLHDHDPILITPTGIPHFYIVRANDGTHSNIAEGYTIAYAYHFPPSLYLPLYVENPKLDNNTSKNWVVGLSWSKMQGAVQYEIQIALRNYDTWNETEGITNNPNDIALTTRIDTNTYNWQVIDSIKDYTTPLTLGWAVRAIFPNGQLGKFTKGTFTLNPKKSVASQNLPLNIDTIAINKKQLSTNEQIGITLKIVKQPNTNPTNPKLLYFLSKDDSFSKDDAKLAEDLLTLENNTSQTIRRYFTVETNIAPGKYYLLAIPENDGNKYT